MSRSRQTAAVCSSRFLVYGLVDPQTDVVRYIGKSSSGLTRPKYHLYRNNIVRENHTHKRAWLLELFDRGLRPAIRVLKECSSNEEVEEAERLLIKEYRQNGVGLTNLAEGGTSGSIGASWSEASRRRLAETNKSNPVRMEHIRQLGSKWKGTTRSEETKQKMSEAKRKWWAEHHEEQSALLREIGKRRRGQPLAPKQMEHIRKIGLQNRGKPKSEETKRKMAEATKAWWAEHRDEQTERIRQAMQFVERKPPSPAQLEHARQLGLQQRGKRTSEETKRKQSEVRKAWWTENHAEKAALVGQGSRRRKGKPLSPEHLEALRRGGLKRRGSSMSEETKRRMSEAKKAMWAARKAAAGSVK